MSARVYLCLGYADALLCCMHATAKSKWHKHTQNTHKLTTTDCGVYTHGRASLLVHRTRLHATLLSLHTANQGTAMLPMHAQAGAINDMLKVCEDLHGSTYVHNIAKTNGAKHCVTWVCVLYPSTPAPHTFQVWYGLVW